MATLPDILFETRHILVINKPEGMAVHPGPRTSESLESLLPAYQPGRPPPQAIHRLDRDTSGCLMLGRTASATRRLSRLFAEGNVRKTYWAIVRGLPGELQSGTVEAPLAKVSSRERGWRMVPTPDGKPALTRWQVLKRQGELALVAFSPRTGRTHQLRVHATLLSPRAAIVGDPVYGTAHPLGMMLHARALAFVDPWSEQQITVEAPCPARFRQPGFPIE